MKRLLTLLCIPLFISLFFLKAHAQSQTVINGSNTTAINFPGTGCVYNWVNDNPNIGLAASGTGNIASFKAINNGNTPIVATITATPVSTGYAYFANSTTEPAGGYLNTVSVMSTSTNTLVATIKVGFSPVGVSASPDGSRLYVTNANDGTVSVINTSTNTVISTIKVGSYPYGVIVSADGSKAYVTNYNDGNISVINTTTNTVLGILPAGANPLCIAISPDGSKVYTTNNNANTVSVIDVVKKTILTTVNVGWNPWGVALNPDGSQVYVANSGQSTISVINTSTYKVSSVNVQLHPEGIAVTPDGSRVYVKNAGANTVSVINTVNNTVIATIPVGPGPLGVSISSDGSRVYVVNEFSSTVSIISTATNTVIATAFAGEGANSIGNFVIDGSDCKGMPVTFKITVNPTPPLPNISETGSLTGFHTIYGTASAASSLSIAGTNLISGITVIAPQGFEVSTNNVTFSNMLTVGATGTIAATPIYVRLKATAAAGSYQDNIVLKSTGAPDESIKVTGTVMPAPLTVTATRAVKTYGNVLTSSTNSTAFTVTGLQNAETIGNVSLTYTKGATASDAPGIYTGSVIVSAATGGTFSLDNYIITYIPNDILVNTALLTITATDKARIYGTANPPFTITYSGFVNQDNEDRLTILPIITTTATIISPAGQYPIIASGAASMYYSFAYVPGILTIYASSQNLTIPSAFTPNGDGINDLWDIKGLFYYPTCKVEIFNRYGQAIYQSTGYNKPWDGTFNGKPLPLGTYYYMIIIDKNSKPLSGYVSIIK